MHSKTHSYLSGILHLFFKQTRCMNKYTLQQDKDRDSTQCGRYLNVYASNANQHSSRNITYKTHKHHLLAHVFSVAKEKAEVSSAENRCKDFMSGETMNGAVWPAHMNENEGTCLSPMFFLNVFSRLSSFVEEMLKIR